MRVMRLWIPAWVMGLGAVFTVGVDHQRAMPLEAPLDSVMPGEFEGLAGHDITLSDMEVRVAGVSDYLMRNYTGALNEGPATLSLYIGYYDRQTQGKTIHSPKNCLPGAGWEALASTGATIETDAGPVQVNRYVLQKGSQRALVLYWYQGRGRVQANEYVVKWDLLRDAATRQRTEEALVRLVVPFDTDEDRAFQLAARAAGVVISKLTLALPG